MAPDYNTQVKEMLKKKLQPNGDHNSTVQHQQYTVLPEHIHKKRNIRVVCIGAGISGIAAAYKFQRRLTDAMLTIYEKNHDVGGTWLENK